MYPNMTKKEVDGLVYEAWDTLPDNLKQLYVSEVLGTHRPFTNPLALELLKNTTSKQVVGSTTSCRKHQLSSPTNCETNKEVELVDLTDSDAVEDEGDVSRNITDTQTKEVEEKKHYFAEYLKFLSDATGTTEA
jgi:hypothetical protein